MTERFETRRLEGPIKITLSTGEKWGIAKQDLCAHILHIVQRYQAQGYTMSLRQLYYQLVAGGVIRNDDVVYKRLGGVVDDLRYSGMLDWGALEDRGRQPKLPFAAADVGDAMRIIAGAFRLPRQQGQQKHIEVWTEKDAIAGILADPCAQYHVHLCVNKGYSSSAAMHVAYRRFAEAMNAGQQVVVLYLGDHDPSGLDMVRDIRERIGFFLAFGDELDTDKTMADGRPLYEHMDTWLSEEDIGIYHLLNHGLITDKQYQAWRNGDEDAEALVGAISRRLYIEANLFTVQQIGLTTEQVEYYNPPPNPAKLQDPRAEWYVRKHGKTSWEVDALEPSVLVSLVTEAIHEHLDADVFEAVQEQEAEQRGILRFIQQNWRTLKQPDE